MCCFTVNRYLGSRHGRYRFRLVVGSVVILVGLQSLVPSHWHTHHHWNLKKLKFCLIFMCFWQIQRMMGAGVGHGARRRIYFLAVSDQNRRWKVLQLWVQDMSEWCTTESSTNKIKWCSHKMKRPPSLQNNELFARLFLLRYSACKEANLCDTS